MVEFSTDLELVTSIKTIKKKNFCEILINSKSEVLN